MSKVAIIDYNCGNIFSLANALNTIKQPFDIVDTASSLAKYDHAILPGVGSFGPAMRHLIDIGFDDELREFASKKKTVLGICLGMQLLLSESHENGLHNGIGLIDGVVEKITVIDGKERVPNIGWHTINNNSLSQIPYKFFDGQNVGKQYYFIHSYHAIPRHNVDVSASIDYGGNKLAAVIGNESVIGVQFHPEKSGKDGLELLGKLKAEYWN